MDYEFVKRTSTPASNPMREVRQFVVRFRGKLRLRRLTFPWSQRRVKQQVPAGLTQLRSNDENTEIGMVWYT